MSSAITQMAMAVIAKEQAEKRAKEQAELQAAIASREAEERSVMRQRVALEAERLMAAKEAERLVAEEQAARAREAEEVALRAEIERLRNRSETEILRDEVASLRAEMATLRRMTPTKEVVQESIYSHLRADGELDMRFRSSKQELSVVQQEVAELKSQMASLLKGGFRIRNVCGNVLDIGGGGIAGNIIAHPWHGQNNQVWFLEQI
jgi:multidrug efflux pump subunit AcrA (membrane-fusion protein)